jgi:hypothetical protein
MAGAREFPAGDPRRAEWIANADREPMENPVRSQASKDFEDPWKLAKRTAFGAAEGGAGGIVGAKVPAQSAEPTRALSLAFPSWLTS